METEQSSSDNLRIVYDEITQLHERQDSSTDLLYNKLNWVLVSSIVFLGAILTSSRVNLLVVFLVTFSAISALVGFRPIELKSTAKISDLVNKVGDEGFMRSLIKKKVSIFNTNKPRLDTLELFVQASIYSLILALIFQFMDFYLYL